MRLRIRGAGALLLELDLVTLLRVEAIGGRAHLPDPALDELEVELEIEPADELAVCPIDVPRVKPGSTLRRRLLARIPARLPTDELDG